MTEDLPQSIGFRVDLELMAKCEMCGFDRALRARRVGIDTLVNIKNLAGMVNTLVGNAGQWYFAAESELLVAHGKRCKATLVTLTNKGSIEKAARRFVMERTEAGEWEMRLSEVRFEQARENVS